MTRISHKATQWIDEGKDPRSVHWQIGLESVLDLFKPMLEPGRLIPVQSLDDRGISLFLKALEIVDLSPNLLAAFLPPSVADNLIPPESAEELQHIEKGKPSFKILISRPEKEERILCAEISEYAQKPGVDIFQSGTLLGTYDFENQEDCLAELNRIIRVHIWQKGKWLVDDYIQYTLNWFEKKLELRQKTISVETDYSFFHSPTLIKSNKIDVIFILIEKIIKKYLNDPDSPLKAEALSIRSAGDEKIVDVQLHDLVDKAVFELLKVMQEDELVEYDAFTKKEMAAFNLESAGTIERLVSYIQAL